MLSICNNKIVGLVPQFFFSLVLIFATSCGNGNDTDIFQKGKTWDYTVSLSDSMYQFTNLSLELQKGFFSLLQKKIVWESEYNNNSNGNKIKSSNMTGVYESSDRIWLHPPRFGPLKKLETFPFPEVRFPLEINKRWESSISVVSGYDELNGKKVISDYTITHVIGDSICEIYAKSKVDSIESVFEAYFTFHTKKGFLSFSYFEDSVNIIEIKLIESL